MTEFCPRCGTPRMAGMRFCSKCGLDLDQLPRAAARPGSPVPSANAVPGTRTSNVGRDGNSLVVIAAGALVVVGSFLPWVTIYSAFANISRSGLEGGGDGVITLILGIGILIIGLTRFLGVVPPAGLIRFWPPLIAGVIVVVIAFIDGTNVSSRIEQSTSAYVSGSVGAGLFVVGVGGVLSALAAFGSLTAGPRPVAPQQSQLGSAGWWKIDSSDLPDVATGASVHLDFQPDGLQVEESIGKPIVVLRYANQDLRVKSLSWQALGIEHQNHVRATLSQSADAIATDAVVDRWRGNGGRG